MGAFSSKAAKPGAGVDASSATIDVGGGSGYNHSGAIAHSVAGTELDLDEESTTISPPPRIAHSSASGTSNASDAFAEAEAAREESTATPLPNPSRKQRRASSSSTALSSTFLFGRRSSVASKTADPADPADTFEVGPDEAGWDGNRASMMVEEVSGRGERRRLRDEEQCLQFNQTGQSSSEIRALQKYASVPDRDRPPGFQALEDDDNTRRESRAARKTDRRDSKAAKKNEKEVRKGKRPPPAPVAHEGTVEYAIAKTKRFGVLNLAKMHLTSIPDSVFDQVDGMLRVINLSHNNLPTIDTRFTELVLIQRLIAASNSITTLPPEIKEMSALQYLDLSDNNLSELPDSFSSMPLLQQIDLSNNSLSTLPDSFATLNIASLKLTGNKFISAPPVIDAMRSLRALHLDHNSLVSVPSSWSALSEIDTLNLAGNTVTSFPDEILAKCEYLSTLNLRTNPLTSTQLAALPSWPEFDSRRMSFHKYRLDSGAISAADLMITDA